MNQLFIFLILTTLTVTLPLPTHNVINCHLLTPTHCLDNPELVLECNRHDLCKELRASSSNNCQFCLYVAGECREEPDEEEEGELEQELCQKGSNTSCDAIVDKICDYIMNLSDRGKTIPSEAKICSSLGYCTYRGKDADGRAYVERELEVIARLLSVPINSIPRDELSCEKLMSALLVKRDSMTEAVNSCDTNLLPTDTSEVCKLLRSLNWNSETKFDEKYFCDKLNI